MSYKIKETYLTIQGEGAHMGRVAIFCRFSGCNLWSGREKDRKKIFLKNHHRVHCRIDASNPISLDHYP